LLPLLADATIKVMRSDAVESRRRLLLATRDAVADHGPGVSVRSIGDRAGVGVTTIYRHFHDKGELIDGVSIARWQTMLRIAIRIQARSCTGRGVPMILDTFTRMVTEDDRFIEAAELRVGRTPYAILPVKSRFDAVYARLWAAAQAQGSIRRGVDHHDAMEIAGHIRDPDRRAQQVGLLIAGICAASDRWHRDQPDAATMDPGLPRGSPSVAGGGQH
jgi:AcrR family transcriptional regulator